MGKRILVVDDEANVRHMLKEYLMEHGFNIEIATDGRQAMFVAREFKPDLILLDIMMPEMDGLSFMRNHQKESHTPIILLTAKVDETDKVIGLELGADDYVTKPFGMREFTVSPNRRWSACERLGSILTSQEHTVSRDARPNAERKYVLVFPSAI